MFCQLNQLKSDSTFEKASLWAHAPSNQIALMHLCHWRNLKMFLELLSIQVSMQCNLHMPNCCILTVFMKKQFLVFLLTLNLQYRICTTTYLGQKNVSLFLRQWVQKILLTSWRQNFFVLSMCVSLNKTVFHFGSLVRRTKRSHKLNAKLRTLSKLSHESSCDAVKYLFICVLCYGRFIV